MLLPPQAGRVLPQRRISATMPDRAIASRGELASRTRDGVVDRTRPLCRYPQQAVDTGSRSTDDAETLVGRMP